MATHYRAASISETIRNLTDSLSEAQHSAFSVDGEVPIPVPLPTISVEGIGSLGWPVSEAAIEQMKTLGEAAPFGKGSQTIVDSSVRDAIQIDASKVKCCNLFQNLLHDIKESVCDTFDLTPHHVAANLHKIVLYTKGGHFDTHTDTEKEPRMFGTLVVELPCSYQGGALEIKHNGMTKTYLGNIRGNTSKIRYAALYSSCKHRVLPVTSGNRLVMLFNLVTRTSEVPTSAEGLPANQILAETVKTWPKGFIALHKLEYKYSEANPTEFRGNDRATILTLKDAVDEYGEPLFDIVMGDAEKTERRDGETEYDSSFVESDSSCLLDHPIYPSDDEDITLDLSDLPDSRADECNCGFFPNGDLWLFDEPDEVDGEHEYMGNYAATVEYFYRAKLIAVYPRRDRYIHQQKEMSVFEELEDSNPKSVPSMIGYHLHTAQDVAEKRRLFSLHFHNYGVEESVELAKQIFEDPKHSKDISEIITKPKFLNFCENPDFVLFFSKFILNSLCRNSGDKAILTMLSNITSQVLLLQIWKEKFPIDIPLQVVVLLVNRNSIVQHEKQSELFEKLWSVIKSNITKLSASQLSALFDCAQKNDQCKTKCDELLKQYNLMQVDTHRVAITCLSDATDNRELILKAASDLLDRKEDLRRFMVSASNRNLKLNETDSRRKFVTTIISLNDDELTLKFLSLMLHDTSTMGSSLLNFASNETLSQIAVVKLVLGVTKEDAAKLTRPAINCLAKLAFKIDDQNVWKHFLDIFPFEYLSGQALSDVGARMLNMENENVVTDFLRKVLCSPKNVFHDDSAKPSIFQCLNNICRISETVVHRCFNELTDDELNSKVSTAAKEWIAAHLPPLETTGAQVWERLLKYIPLKTITKTLSSKLASKLFVSREGQELVLKYLCAADVPALVRAIVRNVEVILLFKSLILKVEIANDDFNARIAKSLQDMNRLSKPFYKHRAQNDIVPGFKAFMENSLVQIK